MTPPPLPLDEPSVVLEQLSQIPVRAHERHVDLMVFVGDGRCESSRLVLIDNVPGDLAQHERASALGRFWRTTVRELDDVCTAVVALCRLGPPVPTGDDYAWHDAVRATATTAGVVCLGVYLSTPAGTVEVVPRAAYRR